MGWWGINPPLFYQKFFKKYLTLKLRYDIIYTELRINRKGKTEMTKQQIEFHKKLRNAERNRVNEMKDNMKVALYTMVGFAFVWVALAIA
jgi:hypothetical protein